MDEILELESVISEPQGHINQMVRLYQDIGKLTWKVASGKVMYGQVATKSGTYYEQLTQEDRELSDDELLQFGVLKFQEANFQKSLRQSESSLYEAHHQLFTLVRENLLGRLVQVRSIDDKPHIDVIGMSTKGSYFPERVKKGEKMEVRGRIMLPPTYQDSLDMQVRPTRRGRVLRNVSDYLVRVVDPFGKKVLVDINLID